MEKYIVFYIKIININIYSIKKFYKKYITYLIYFIYIIVFEIPFDEDFYGIKFFYFKIRQNPDYSAKEDELYINKMEKLADDYESFFLSKNPRNYSKKDEKEDIKRKNSELKTLLKNLDSFDKSNEELKLQFLLSAVKYKPNLNHHILNLNKISQ